MNLPWDKYEYSEPFPVQVGLAIANYFSWRRNVRTGQYKLKRVGPIESIWAFDQNYKAPNPIELFPPVLKK